MTTIPSTTPPTGPRYFTPLVKATAANLSVDLAGVTGTGVAGRVTVDDVRRAAGRPAGPSARHVALAQPTARPARAPHLVPMRENVIAPGLDAPVDVFAANPYLELLRAGAEHRIAAAEAATGQSAPTLFAAGDVPTFTASGITPTHLLQLPWTVRHAAAQADLVQAQRIFERCGTGVDPATALLNAGEYAAPMTLHDYHDRFTAWVDAGQKGSREG